MTKTTNFGKKYCMFCKHLNNLSAILDSFYCTKKEHILLENCHEYYISKIKVIL